MITQTSIRLDFVMYEYFKMLEEESKLDKNNYDILTLTKKIALDAGYHRAKRTFKNGAVRDSTQYTKSFDSVLTAKWLIFYRKWFISELRQHVDLIDKQIEIINNTFLMFMSYLNLDKLTSPSTVTAYVKRTLAHRIKSAALEKVTTGKVEKFKKQTVKQRREKVILHQKNIIDDTSISLDGYLTNHTEDTFCGTQDQNSPTEDLILDIKNKLKENPYGERVLESLLYSDGQVSLSRLCNYMSIRKEEETTETKKYIRDAYNIIKNTLRNYVQKPYIYDWSNVNLSKICFESSGSNG